VRIGWYREVPLNSLDSRLSRCLIQRCVLEYSYLELNVAERKWPGEPCRPAGEKTPPTAPLLIKNLISTPELGGVFCLPAS